MIRHGQTDWNVEGRWQGHKDIPLNAEGRRQARTLAAYLRDQPITAIISSDLLRARQTAAPLAEALQLEPTFDPRWRELNLGAYQGLTGSEIRQRFPDGAVQMVEDYLDFPFPDGETRRQMQARALAAFSDVVAGETGEEVAVVTHGGTIRVVLMALFSDDEALKRVSVHNTSITTVGADDSGNVRLIAAPDVPHLFG